MSMPVNMVAAIIAAIATVPSIAIAHHYLTFHALDLNCRPEVKVAFDIVMAAKHHHHCPPWPKIADFRNYLMFV